MKQPLSGVIPDRVHGSWNGYTNYRCRCAGCVQAARDYRQAWDGRVFARVHCGVCNWKGWRQDDEFRTYHLDTETRPCPKCGGKVDA